MADQGREKGAMTDATMLASIWNWAGRAVEPVDAQAIARTAATRLSIQRAITLRLTWAAWKSRSMAGRAGLAIAAAFVTVVAVAGLNLVRWAVDTGSSDLASPRPSPETIGTLGPRLVFPRPGPLPMGSYGAIVNGVPFTFTVPLNGWSAGPSGSGTLENGYYPGSAWIRFWSPDNVNADPCAGTALDPPVGAGVDDLAAAITALRGVNASPPTDVTVGGFRGKYVELAVGEEPYCDRPDLSLWYDAHDGDRRPATRGSTVRVWILDVNGARLVIDSEAPTPPLTGLQPFDDPNGAAGDIRRIVGSIRIVAIPADVVDYFDQVRGICDTAARRFQADPAVVGGPRERAPEFTDLEDAGAHAAAVVRISDAALRDVRAVPVPPELDNSRVGEAYAVLESAVDLMRQVPAAARAGDEGLVSSLMSEAYQLTNFGSINPANGAELIPEYEPLGLGLLAPSISGCRLPSGGG